MVRLRDMAGGYHAIHKEVYEWFNINFDHFGRTSTPQQTEICQSIFSKLLDNNWLSENTMQQLYCESCQSTWTEAGDEVPGKCRHVNCVIGILLKEHFPGMVTLPGEGNVPEVARTWDHYKACEDVGTFNNIEVHNKAERVFAKIWDFYRCEDGKLEEAQVNVNIHCKKLVRNMFYDARIIVVRSYKASKGYKMATKTPATKIFLTKEEYMQVVIRMFFGLRY
ncbi:methionyl-tRNA synthetase [Hordeum vulgare]|nr:methionyl-tRNA synthetase [Hordeum vulgare]